MSRKLGRFMPVSRSREPQPFSDTERVSKTRGQIVIFMAALLSEDFSSWTEHSCLSIGPLLPHPIYIVIIFPAKNKWNVDQSFQSEVQENGGLRHFLNGHQLT